MKKLLVVPLFFTACLMSIFGITFTILLTAVCFIAFAFGRIFLCPLGKHVSGWVFKSSHFENGVEVLTRHDVHCAFCDHIDRKVV